MYVIFASRKIQRFVMNRDPYLRGLSSGTEFGLSLCNVIVTHYLYWEAFIIDLFEAMNMSFII